MRGKFAFFLIAVAVISIACDGDGGRPGEIAMSVTITPSERPSAQPSKSPDKPDEPPGDKGDKEDNPEVVRVPGGADLTELPERAAAVCDKGFPLKKTCPSLVPVIQKNRSYVIDSFGRPGGHFQVLEMAAGATGANFARNNPPGVAHLVVEVAKQLYLVPLGTPVETSESLDSLLSETRSSSYLVSPEPSWKWNKPLILAESFPGGGAHGDHLVYEWQRGARSYRVSLHAWTPAVESVRTLHAIVKSIR